MIIHIPMWLIYGLGGLVIVGAIWIVAMIFMQLIVARAIGRGLNW